LADLRDSEFVSDAEGVQMMESDEIDRETLRYELLDGRLRPFFGKVRNSLSRTPAHRHPRFFA